MQVVIAGGSGFLGSALRARLRADGHAVAVLTRRPRPAAQDEISWMPDGTAGPWSGALDGIDAVVNLAGEGIADERWTEPRKQALRDSRLLSTRSIVAAVAAAAQPPRALVSGSAVGYYGPHGDEIVTEDTPPGADFLAHLCVEWEREAMPAATHTRVAVARTGLVLHPRAGALRQMLLPFRFGVGGRLGSGTQYMPWIHVDDWVDLVMWLIADARAQGPFNVTAPHPVTNQQFTTTLARVLNRPALLPVPAFGLQLIVGELAHSILTGQRAIPARAQEMGFSFRYAELEAALHALLK
jgi:uncharacterized protein (TIGR01777 family)